MTDNIVQARFLYGRSTKTRAMWQWDYGIILQFDGLDLPPVYTVHFANQPQSGNALQQVGGIGGVVVPDALLETGLNVYAWVYLHTGEDDGETVYSVMIPVNKRPKPTNETPTPAQQSALDEAIIALNDGVSAAEAAAALLEHPAAQAETLAAGSAATAAYSDGTFSFGIPRGPAGADGQNGADGQDGYSPTATVTQTESGATVTVTDRNGTTTANLTNGRDGTNGKDGAPGVGVPSGGTTGQILAKKTGTDYDTEWVTETHPVSDVQVNGTSVVSGGVANVPKGSATNIGAVGSIIGSGLIINGDGYIRTDYATGTTIKSGADSAKPITSAYNKYAIFYGLANAAGDSTQKLTSNFDLVYTETAKSKISDMLNAPETISGSTPSITAKAGVRYICGEVSTLDITTPASGIVDITFTSGSTPTVLTVTPPTGMTMKWANGFDPTQLEPNTIYEIRIRNGNLASVIYWD